MRTVGMKYNVCVFQKIETIQDGGMVDICTL